MRSFTKKTMNILMETMWGGGKVGVGVGGRLGKARQCH